MTSAGEIDADRVIADLRELQRRTSSDRGAQRVAWTETWHEARAFLGELLEEIGATSDTDEAGNIWARLDGDEGEGALAVGSHLDSVPDGGWLDGALGVMTAVGVLRAHAQRSSARRPLVLVDWADEEGSRFGYSLFGSSAFAGELDPDAVAGLKDSGGRTLREVLAENDVDVDRGAQVRRAPKRPVLISRASHRARAGSRVGGRQDRGRRGLPGHRTGAFQVHGAGGACRDDADGNAP